MILGFSFLGQEARRAPTAEEKVALVFSGKQLSALIHRSRFQLHTRVVSVRVLPKTYALEKVLASL